MKVKDLIASLAKERDSLQKEVTSLTKEVERLRGYLERIANHDGHRHSTDPDEIAWMALEGKK